MSEAPTQPLVSVVIASYEAHETVERCLEALSRQSFADFEAIIVDSSPDTPTAEIVRRRFPDVVLDAVAERLGPHAARNRGAARASGRILVFTDPDCFARPDWLGRLVAAHAAGLAIVGGAVAAAEAGWFDRGVHWCKFGPWVPGGAPGPRPVLPTANVAWSRSAWEAVGPFRLEGWSGDADLCFRARAAGYELHFEPAAVVAHRHLTRPGAFWHERVERGWAFARLRLRTEHWSRGRAALHAVLSPLVPLLLLVRSLRRASVTGHARDGVLTVPVQLFGFTAWGLGEARAQFSAALGASG